MGSDSIEKPPAIPAADDRYLSSLTPMGVASAQDAAELDATGAKVIELYQNQLALTDRIWAYFSQYSALLSTLACVVAVHRSSGRSEERSGIEYRWEVASTPLLLYLVLALGNHRALAMTVRELEIIRGIAVTRTRYKFEGFRSGQMMLFHLVLSVLVSAVYFAACYGRLR